MHHRLVNIITKRLNSYIVISSTNIACIPMLAKVILHAIINSDFWQHLCIYAPGLKSPPGPSSVLIMCLSVCSSVCLPSDR